MNTIRRAVAPLLVCLLLLPLLLRDSALAAADQNRPAGDKAWRVIYVEGGPFSDYQRIFQGLALGLEERGLIRNGHVPLPKDSEEVRGMWEWLHRHAGGNRLVFLADGFYSAEWDSRQRERCARTSCGASGKRRTWTWSWPSAPGPGRILPHRTCLSRSSSRP